MEILCCIRIFLWSIWCDFSCWGVPPTGKWRSTFHHGRSPFGEYSFFSTTTLSKSKQMFFVEKAVFRLLARKVVQKSHTKRSGFYHQSPGGNNFRFLFPIWFSIWTIFLGHIGVVWLHVNTSPICLEDSSSHDGPTTPLQATCSTRFKTKIVVRRGSGYLRKKWMSSC